MILLPPSRRNPNHSYSKNLIDVAWNMNRKLPNQLTVARIILAAAFFVLLGMYRQDAKWGSGMLNAAFVLYIVAGVTDVLDGCLARKWNVTSAFGRIADPFVDKVLVVGAFVMLTGSNFAALPDGPGVVSTFERDLPGWITGGMISIVQPWMVVAIFAREFIVSAFRSYSESQGIKFPATYAGKIKMFLQSVAICTVLYQLANLPHTQWAICMKIVSMWFAVIVTVGSGFAYVGKARRLLSAAVNRS